MGYFIDFERGKRTDAIIKNNKGENIAQIEWEWLQPIKGSANEIDKLKETHEEFLFSSLITYSNIKNLNESLEKINDVWKDSQNPLLLFLVTYHLENGKRKFDDLITYHFDKGHYKKIRSQYALPWKVEKTRWESYKHVSEKQKKQEKQGQT